MKTQQAFIGARGIDCVSILTDASAAALRNVGMDFAVRYLGGITANEARAITNAGLALMVVTYADRFNGAEAAPQCAALGLPAGATVWLDLEGIGASLAPETVVAEANAWAQGVIDGGYMPGLYVGAGCKLTSEEVYALKHVRYWKGQSRLLDRNGALVEPACGWCLTQTYPHCNRAGVDVDVDFVGEDYRGRLPVWIIA